jgi:hypothetical protein
VKRGFPRQVWPWSKRDNEEKNDSNIFDDRPHNGRESHPSGKSSSFRYSGNASDHLLMTWFTQSCDFGMIGGSWNLQIRHSSRSEKVYIQVITLVSIFWPNLANFEKMW